MAELTAAQEVRRTAFTLALSSTSVVRVVCAEAEPMERTAAAVREAHAIMPGMADLFARAEQIEAWLWMAKAP
jgi:hypothetical protein